MRRFVVLLAVLAISIYSQAAEKEKPQSHPPLSLDPPPTPIDGVEVQQVVDYFKSLGYQPFGSKDGKSYCSPRGCYHWAMSGPKGRVGTVDIDSFTGDKDFVRLHLQIAGANREGAGGESRVLQFVARVRWSAGAYSRPSSQWMNFFSFIPLLWANWPTDCLSSFTNGCSVSTRSA
jgi:hypothetical protein